MRASIFEKDQRLRLSRDGLAAWTWLRSTGIAAAVGVAYFLAAQLSNSFLITPETVIFWPAAGISSGLLISLWSAKAGGEEWESGWDRDDAIDQTSQLCFPRYRQDRIHIIGLSFYDLSARRLSERSLRSPTHLPRQRAESHPFADKLDPE
jgi:hypothetical protein